MERLSNYAALSAEALPEFLQVEAFSKLNNAIGKVNLSILVALKLILLWLECSFEMGKILNVITSFYGIRTSFLAFPFCKLNLN